MPAYITASPQVSPRRGITAGLPAYSAGSFPVGQQPARMYVTSVAVSANVATVGVKMVEGNVPAVGALATVTGTVAGGSPVNVTNVGITAISLNTQGVGTITYPATTGNLATTPDGGQVLFNPSDVAETLAVQKFQQFALAPDGGYGLSWAWGCPSAPASIALQLECAIDDVDGQYALAGVSQTTTSGSVLATAPIGTRFVRVNVTSAAGGASPTLWAKIYQSTNAGN